MYPEFFQLGSLPLDQLKGSYDLQLVSLSYLIAVLASYVALDLTGRLRDRTNSKKESALWLIGGAVAMGSGIWAMHFIGMLSFSIQGVNIEYDIFWTVFSWFVAVVASGFALFFLTKPTISFRDLVGGGLILGLAIAAMHYTGMTAMLITLDIAYLPALFSISVLIAITASIAAIWLALKSNMVIFRLRNRIKIIAALIMGVAITGMHYTGMSASVLTLCKVPLTGTGIAIDHHVLSGIVAGMTFLILAIAFIASSLKEAKNQEQFELARELGMAEISASVLHNVGNVLNSVNVSVDSIIMQGENSPLNSIVKLSELLNAHKTDLAHFLTEDPKGSHIVEYIHELARCYEREHENNMKEMQELSNNVELIKQIISTQQAVVRVESPDQIVSINDLLDEALLLSGVTSKNEIKLIKKYDKIKPTQINKIKLFQIVSNIITNGKDALLESSIEDKTLTIQTSLEKDRMIKISVSDNGLGIEKSKLKKIFNFGFTTKKAGHGFGLHASAIAVNQMGGEIQVESEGLGKGATFTIIIPYSRANLLKNT